MKISISALSIAYGLTPEALRYYEEKGLLSPDRAASSGFRRFSIADVQRLGIIKSLQRQGFSLDEIKRILLVGFEDGTKEFSEDGTVITSTASDGRILTKTFTNGFLTMTSVLKSAAGAEVARAVKTFNADGSLISTVVTYS